MSIFHYLYYDVWIDLLKIIYSYIPIYILKVFTEEYVNI